MNNPPNPYDYQNIEEYQTEIQDMISIPELKVVDILNKKKLIRKEITELRESNRVLYNRESFKKSRNENKKANNSKEIGI